MNRTYIPPNANPIPNQAKQVFAGEIFSIYQWDQERFDGSIKVFEMAKRPDSVEVIAVTDNKILVCKERQPHTDYFLDIPAGMHDMEGEDELAAAKRELREETGYVFNDWKLLSAQQMSKKLDQICYTFLATEVKEVIGQQLDTGEQIEVMQYSFEEFKAMKKDPIARSYPSHVMDEVSSIEELLALPSLHQYS